MTHSATSNFAAMVNSLFISQNLLGRSTELRQISQILLQDDDFLLVGAPGVGRRTLIWAAAQQVGAKVLEIDCLRSTSAARFLRLLADSITDSFSMPTELSFLDQWTKPSPLVLEQPFAQRPRLTWHSASSQEWDLFETLLALPQAIAEWLNCRVVIMFLNFPHMRSWDRSGKWERYLQQEIQQQNRVSYALVATVVEAWVQQGNLSVVSLAPLSNAVMQDWIVSSMATEALQFDPEALRLFLSIVQGHMGDAITLARRIWLDRRAFAPPAKSEEVMPGLIEPHHVHRSTLALTEELSTTFESLILLLPPSQVRVLESLALDPTDKPQSRSYIQKHQLTRGGGLQGALSSLEQKGLIYGAQHQYRIALPFLAFWLKRRVG